MKSSQSILITIVFLLSGAAWAGAGNIPQTKISCTNASNPNSQKIIFQGPSGVDLRFMGNLSSPTIPLKINGGSDVFEFKVQKSQTRTGEQVHYTYRHPFFISDIHIIFNRGYFNTPSSLNATWTHDYPQATDLNCEFLP